MMRIMMPLIMMMNFDCKITLASEMEKNSLILLDDRCFFCIFAFYEPTSFGLPSFVVCPKSDAVYDDDGWYQLAAQAAEVLVILVPATQGRFWEGVEVKLGVDRDVVLHVVVPLPVAHHRCLQVIPGIHRSQVDLKSGLTWHGHGRPHRWKEPHAGDLARTGCSACLRAGLARSPISPEADIGDELGFLFITFIPLLSHRSPLPCNTNDYR